MSNADSFLKKTLGEDFFESLSKVELWKPGTKSTVDHEELRTALQIVPRTIIALLIKELIPMNIGETKEIPLFVGNNSLLRTTKHERDVYSGEIEEENKKIVEFKFRALPGVGLVIMSAFELYDMENLINTSSQPTPSQGTAVNFVDDVNIKVQKLIDERLALHSLVEQVVEKRLAHKEAIHQMMLVKLSHEVNKLKTKQEQIIELPKINEQTTPQSEEYFRGMTNGMKVAEAVVTDKEPNFIEPVRKSRPLETFLEKRKKPKEFSIQMAKGELVSCPDCGNNIFKDQVFSGCVCYGDNGKVFIKKSENGIKIRFGRNWDEENIMMLLEVLQRKNK